MSEQRPRGLSAIQQTKDARKRRKFPIIPGRVILWTVIVLSVWGILYYKRTQAQLDSAKAKLFERQREIAARIGPSFEPLRDKIEAWTMSASAPYEGDWIDPAAKNLDFMGRPGVYLRLRMGDASDVETIRKAAQDSLRDGFTSCLFRIPNPDPASGPPCRDTRDCAEGTFCNEHDRCTQAAQPYNMRTIYRGTRVLMDEWTVDLRATTNDLRLRLLNQELDVVSSEDVPRAVEALSQAEFFLLVLDEDPATGLEADAGMEAIQAVPHPARVFLFGLRAPHEGPLLRLRRDVDARILATGAGVISATPETLAAQQRQANSCSLALHVKNALEE